MGYSSSDAHIYIYIYIYYRSLSMCQYLLLISTRHFRSRANLVDLFIFDNRNLRAMTPSRTPPEPVPLPPHTPTEVNSMLIKLQIGKGTSRQRSGKGAIRKRFPLQKPRWEKTKLTIRYLYHENTS